MDKNKSGNTKKIILVLVLLLVIGGIFGVVGILKKNSSLGVKIVKNDVSKITLEDYQNDALSLKKPAGWEVSAGGVGIYYAVRVYDPNDKTNRISKNRGMTTKEQVLKELGRFAEKCPERKIVCIDNDDAPVVINCVELDEDEEFWRYTMVRDEEANEI